MRHLENPWEPRRVPVKREGFFRHLSYVHKRINKYARFPPQNINILCSVFYTIPKIFESKFENQVQLKVKTFLIDLLEWNDTKHR